ncbi:hypothetical protein V2O64_20300 [Verrucomicrobiaceae bacterium 227]
MNELTSNLHSALTLIDAHAERIGKDLDMESQNLKQLVENQDVQTQEQITLLSHSISELHENLAQIRKHLVDSYSAAKRLSTQSSPSTGSDAGSTVANNEEDLDPETAATIRHDEPTTLSGVFRSLLMANEPGQRKRSCQLD